MPRHWGAGASYRKENESGWLGPQASKAKVKRLRITVYVKCCNAKLNLVWWLETGWWAFKRHDSRRGVANGDLARQKKCLIWVAMSRTALKRPARPCTFRSDRHHRR
jgi:hypothetical protein